MNTGSRKPPGVGEGGRLLQAVILVSTEVITVPNSIFEVRVATDRGKERAFVAQPLSQNFRHVLAVTES